jgi:hypothetical protein
MITKILEILFIFCLVLGFIIIIAAISKAYSMEIQCKKNNWVSMNWYCMKKEQFIILP